MVLRCPKGRCQMLSEAERVIHEELKKLHKEMREDGFKFVPPKECPKYITKGRKGISLSWIGLFMFVVFGVPAAALFYTLPPMPEGIKSSTSRMRGLSPTTPAPCPCDCPALSQPGPAPSTHSPRNPNTHGSDRPDLNRAPTSRTARPEASGRPQ